MITKTAHAKINITLEIKGTRPDGYHELDMIFLEIGLGDRIEIKKIPSGIRLSCSDQTLPTGEGNLAWKAARLMSDTYGLKEGVDIFIEKNIPSQAGLGGGSSDAACVMNCINELFALDVPAEELEALSAQLGSDVPFFIQGGCRRAHGRGEILTDRFDFPPCSILVVKPDIAVSTPWAYKAFDEITGEPAACRAVSPTDAAGNISQAVSHTDAAAKISQAVLHTDAAAKESQGVSYTDAAAKIPQTVSHTDIAAKALQTGDYPALCASLYNDLEKPVFEKYPEIEKLKSSLLESGADAAMMTGSGSAVFAITQSAQRGESLRALSDHKGIIIHTAAHRSGSDLKP